MFDILSQRSSFDQIGMEQQAMGIWLYSLLHLYLNDLSRSETGNRSFLIIISLPAVTDVSAFDVFQKKGIYSVVHREMCGKPESFRLVYYTDQRM